MIKALFILNWALSLVVLVPASIEICDSETTPDARQRVARLALGGIALGVVGMLLFGFYVLVRMALPVRPVHVPRAVAREVKS